MLEGSRASFHFIFILLTCGMVPGYGGPSKGREDCTESFKGQIIRLEYLYYKSYWLFVNGITYNGKLKFAQRDQIYDHNRWFSWQMQDCGYGYVCVSNMFTRYRNYFLMFTGDQQYVSNIERDVEDEYRFKVFCDSCENHRRCQLYSKSGRALYSTSNGRIQSCQTCGYPNWFDWDVVLLAPMEDWISVDTQVCNRTPRDIGVHFTNTLNVGVSRKVSETHGMTIEMSTSMSSNPLTWAYSFKATLTSEWSIEKLQHSEQSTSVTIRGASGTDGILTPPNKRAVLKQLVGIYGEPGDLQSGFSFKTNKYEILMEDC